MQSAPKHSEVDIVTQDGKRRSDVVSIEEPLEIWVCYPEQGQQVALSLSVTMRTPGDDLALATGFLFSEGIIRAFSDIDDMQFFGPTSEALGIQNQLKVYLKTNERVADRSFQRHFFSNSSCGVCGKASIQALQMMHEPDVHSDNFVICESALRSLPEKLRAYQAEFEQTGGLHAVALVDSDAEIVMVKEDIGRHNAMDKLIGQRLVDGDMPINDKMVLVSGRASFELLQKSLMADIPFFASIGAPSSAAIALSSTFNATLVGFLKPNGFNVYHHGARIFEATDDG